MRIVPKLSDILNNLKDNIATPYVKHITEGSNPAEIGYCLVNESNDVATKYIVSKDINEFSIDFEDIDMRLRNDISFGVTNEGYMRFWTTNITYYLKWKLQSPEEAVIIPVNR